MKMSIEELKIDSYSENLNDCELTSVKGGSTWACTVVGIVADVVIAAATSGSGSSGGGACTTVTTTTTTTCPDGSISVMTSTTDTCN